MKEGGVTGPSHGSERSSPRHSTAWGWNLCSRLRSQPQGLVVLLRAAGMNQDGREDSSDEEAEESGPWKITLPVAEANHALYT